MSFGVEFQIWFFFKFLAQGFRFQVMGWLKFLCGWRRTSNFFMDFASHEAYRVCRISQCLQSKTQCDHNESKKH
jgi:hypothetical protein